MCGSYHNKRVDVSVQKILRQEYTLTQIALFFSLCVDLSLCDCVFPLSRLSVSLLSDPGIGKATTTRPRAAGQVFNEKERSASYRRK